jgi:hypothetical protein
MLAMSWAECFFAKGGISSGMPLRITAAMHALPMPRRKRSGHRHLRRSERKAAAATRPVISVLGIRVTPKEPMAAVSRCLPGCRRSLAEISRFAQSRARE